MVGSSTLLKLSQPRRVLSVVCRRSGESPGDKLHLDAVAAQVVDVPEQTTELIFRPRSLLNANRHPRETARELRRLVETTLVTLR